MSDEDDNQTAIPKRVCGMTGRRDEQEMSDESREEKKTGERPQVLKLSFAHGRWKVSVMIAQIN